MEQFIHTGYECELQATDFLENFSDDPRTQVIIMYLEVIRDIRKFREVALRVSKRKPIILNPAVSLYSIHGNRYRARP